MNTYKLIGFIDEDYYFYTRIIDNPAYSDPQYIHNKRIFGYLVDNNWIKNKCAKVIIFNFYKASGHVEAITLHHDSISYTIKSHEDLIDSYDDMLNTYLEINLYIETLTFDKNNSDETDIGSIMTLELVCGDLNEEKTIKGNNKINDVKFISVSKIFTKN